MYFFLTLDLDTIQDIGLRLIEEEQDQGWLSAKDNQLCIRKGKQFLFQEELKQGRIILLGDPVFPKEELNWESLLTSTNTPDQKRLFQQIRGHYYYFYLTRETVYIGSSLSGIYPVCYHTEGKKVWIASKASAIAEILPTVRPSRINLLERLLFNFTLLNSTWWENIHLVPADRYLAVRKDKVQVEGVFEIADFFGDPIYKTRRSLGKLIAAFQSEMELFFPDEPFSISFTGGFDSRTIVAAARNAGADFGTYSFGRPSSSDIYFPIRQSKALGIPYTPIYLDEKYLQEHSLAGAYTFLQSSDYNGNFGRPHYTYAAQQLSQSSNFILTGNFGSELFRALHEPGVMISQSLIDLFTAEDDSWKDKLVEATNAWDKQYFKREIDQLITQIEEYLAVSKGLSLNHRFYRFVINDLFRKYFGPEVQMQSQYLNNRTPYLSLPWLMGLNQTIWSGVHARLFEKKINKRMKGQIFYSSFLKRVNKEMYHMQTNKSYSAADVLEFWRLPILVGKVVVNRYLKEAEDNENASQDFLKMHFKQIQSQWEYDQFPAFLSSLLTQSQEEIPAGRRIDYWNKVHSITEGFNNSLKLALTTS